MDYGGRELYSSPEIELHKNGTKTLTQEQVKFLVIQIARGLLHMHRNGVAHRDLKLENVLLDGSLDDGGVVK